MESAKFSAVTSADSFIQGSGVRVVYHPDDNTVTLYRLEGCNAIRMSRASFMGWPIVEGQEVRDFTDYVCTVDRHITGTLGAGERMTITSHSPAAGLVRRSVLEVCTTLKSVVYTKTTYQAGDKEVEVTGFVDSVFELYDPGDVVWSFNGGGEGPTTFYDQCQKIDLTDPVKFSRENRQDCTAAGIPLADIYNAGGGITIGDAFPTRREVHTPVEETGDSVRISIKWPGKTVAADSSVEAGQSFIVVHKGDYYNGLRGYKNAMEHLGIVMQKNISDRSYELRWESWGWAFDWTMDLIIGELDFLQKAGVKQITIDDAWYDHAGDWQLNPEKFPNGEEDMIRLVDAIHAHGMSAILWWRPCDGGRDDSVLHQQHPEYFVMNEDGSTATICGPGKSDTTDWCQTAGYALCPTSEGAIANQTAFINRAMNRWGFDGFKGDFVWSMPKCYHPDHHHSYLEESTERQTDFYRAAYEAMVANDPEVFNLLCNCGAPQDYYGLQYMTQVVTADPTSLDQTRTRAKAYKALMGDDFPVTTDHCQIWYAATIGTGSVIIEKNAFTGAEADEYVRWLNIANREQLHKGHFIGDLYSYGFDPYETYVVKKDGVMYYAFYRDGKRYRPAGYPDIELKGLDSDKMYRIVDYVNDRVVATNLIGGNAVFNTRFTDYLLVKAVEIDTPDMETVDQDYGYTIVPSDEASLAYAGVWKDNGEDRTGEAGSTVELTFSGTSVRWYGRKAGEFGTAEVTLDGEPAAVVCTGGSTETNVRLFEAIDLPAAVHTLKIVCKSGGVSMERIAYEAAIPQAVYEKVDALSERIIYSGTWRIEHGDEFYMGSSKSTNEAGAAAEMSFQGTAIRWYGKRVINHYGIAEVYLDGERIDTAYTYGEDNNGQLLFERTGLTAGEHIIRIVQNSESIDVEYLSYADEA